MVIAWRFIEVRLSRITTLVTQMSVPRSTLVPRGFMHVLVAIILLIGLAACELRHKTIELPRYRSSFSMVQRDNKIYLPGGFDTPNNPTNTIEVLNTDTVDWEDPLIMPEARAIATPILVGSRLVLVGGFSDPNRFQYWNPYNRTMVEFGRLPTVRDYQSSVPRRLPTGNKSVFIDNTGFVDIFDHSKLAWDENEEFGRLLRTTAASNVDLVDDEIWILRPKSTWMEPLEMIFRYNITSQELRNYTTPKFADRDRSVTRCGNGFLLLWTSNSIFGILDPITGTWANITLALSTVSAINSIGNLVLIDNGKELQIYSFDTPTLNGVQVIFDGQVSYMISFSLADKVVYIMPTGEWIIFDAAMTKTTQSPGSLGTIVANFKWTENLHLIADVSNLVTYSSSTDLINLVSTSGLGTGNIRGVFKHNDNIAVIKSDTILFYNQQLELINTISRTPSSAVPVGIAGNDIFYVSSCSVLVNFTEEVPCEYSGGVYSVAQNGIAFAFKGSNVWQSDLNIYDFDTKNWSRIVPQTPLPSNSRFYAYGVPNEHTIWFYTSSKQLRSYNLLNESWSTIELMEDLIRADTRGAEFPVIDGLMYLPILNISFLTINVSSLEQQITSSKDKTLSGTNLQLITSNMRDVIAITSNVALSVECYNTTSQSWFGFEVTIHEKHSLAFLDSALLLRGNSFGDFDTMVTMDVLDTQQRTNVLPDFIRAFDMASISASNITLFAGGRTPSGRSIRTVDVFYMVPPEAPQVPVMDPNPPINEVPVAAIVAPVVCGVAVVAGGLLAFFLIRKKKQRRNASTPVTTIGLASLDSSSFFTPYTEIQFGDILGSGATGQVFIGKWKNTKVALKMSMTQATESLIREIKLMVELRPHPNIVQILGYTVHPETSNIILVLEFCDGGSLDTLLFDKRASPSMNQKIEWIKAIANGVLHLHANNIVHRDLAARNILLSHNEAKITDFGMSRLIGSEGKGTTTSELGPIRWMAPEAIRSKEYSTKSDVWSLGIVMHEILTETEPHATMDPIEAGRQIRDVGLFPSIPNGLDVPQKLVDIIKSCWILDPAERISAAEICERLNSNGAQLEKECQKLFPAVFIFQQSIDTIQQLSCNDWLFWKGTSSFMLMATLD